MALTRKTLKAMGLTEEQVDSVAEAHGETITALQDKIKDLEAKVAEHEDVVKELDALKEGDWKAKYEKEHKDFDAYKQTVTEKETKAAKEKAVRAYFEAKHITGKNLAIAMRGSSAEIEGIELDGDKIKDTKSLDALVDGEFSGLVVTQETKGAKTANPPANNGGSAKTKEEIMAITDTKARQQAIAENHELFGI